MNVTHGEIEEPPGRGRRSLLDVCVSPQTICFLAGVPQTDVLVHLLGVHLLGALWHSPGRSDARCAIHNVSSALNVAVSHGYLKLP